MLPGASPFVIVGQNGDEIPNVPEVQLFGSIRYQAELAVYDGIGTFQDPESTVAARPRTIGAMFRFKY